MPWDRSWGPYNAGRGFVGAQEGQAAASASTTSQSTSTGATPGPGVVAQTEQVMGEARKSYVSEQQLKRAEAKRLDQEAQNEAWRRKQIGQNIDTGSLGFKRFWEGRPELMAAGNPYAHQWLGLSRPAIHEGSGPMNFKLLNMGADYVESRARQAHIENQRDALGVSDAPAAEAAAPSTSSSSSAGIPFPVYGAGPSRPGSQFSALGVDVDDEHLTG